MKTSSHSVIKPFRAGGKFYQPGDFIELTPDQAGRLTGYVESTTTTYAERIRATVGRFIKSKPTGGWQAITKAKPDLWQQHLAACRKVDQAYQNKDGQGVIDALAEAESTFNRLQDATKTRDAINVTLRTGA